MRKPEQTVVTISDDRWWRVERYELVDGHLTPASDAQLQEYSLHDRYNPESTKPRAQGYQPQTRAQARAQIEQSPYQSLCLLITQWFEEPKLRKRGRPMAEMSTNDKESALLGWCNRHGLLGLLPHQLFEVQGLIRGESRTDEKFIRYVRQHDRWVALPMTPEEQFVRATQGMSVEVLVQPFGVTGWLTQSADVALDEYFPGRQGGARQGVAYPLPLSNEFWFAYAEPIEMFLRLARDLNDTLHQILTLREGGTVLDQAGGTVALQDAVSNLQAMAGVVSPRLPLDETGSARLRWCTPSLFSTLVMMALQDLAEDVLVRCKTCKVLFTAPVYKAEFCSRTCRVTMTSRAFQERQREGQASPRTRKEME